MRYNLENQLNEKWHSKNINTVADRTRKIDSSLLLFFLGVGVSVTRRNSKFSVA